MQELMLDIMNSKDKFSEPEKVLGILTSLDVDYGKLVEFANDLYSEIKEPHTNKDGMKFHAITQCILECLKIQHHFSSVKWISDKKLTNELNPGQKLLTFTRINGRGEECLYKIANFDQIDFCREIEYADEFDVIKSKPESAINNLNDSAQKQKQENDLTIKKIINLLRTGENVFITGHAGTGKSYILRKLKEKYKKSLTITSTTGIAAVNVKGQTLHSWAGVGLCRNTIAATVEKIKGRPSQYRQILKCKMLAVDEVSMLNMETLEYVNSVLKLVRENDAPFGGIQVILIGDFFQLPPVEKENDIEKKYCFDSSVWDDLNLKNVVLQKNYRQSEEKFGRALSNMRVNKLTEEDIDLLSSRCIDYDTSDSNMLHIFSTNEEANRYNAVKFNALDEPAKVFTARDGVYRGKELVYEDFTDKENFILEFFNKNCRAEREIILKKGTKVMLLVNMDFDKGLINGACGTIMEFGENSIIINFDNGVNANIPRHEFEYYYNDSVAAVRLQYPLKLAYGITIHKSQGMTLDKLVVDCGRIFERGQVYVAMSRVKTLEGLYLRNFEPEKVRVDSRVAKFYENLEEAPFIELPEEIVIPEKSKSPEVDDEEVERVIYDCVTEFNGLYGKSGISKILTGSKSIKENEYNEKIRNSRFYGIVTGRTRKSVDALIDSMIERNIFIIKKVSFGRPLLCINSI